jgi:hypothetical protein
MPSSLNIWFVLVVSISVLISWTSLIGEGGQSSAPSAPGLSSVSLASSYVESSLEYDFYRQTCPQAEAIVRSSMARIYSEHQDVSPALLRLFFHDCFIEVAAPFPSFSSLLFPKMRVCLFLIWVFICYSFSSKHSGFYSFPICTFIFTNFMMLLSVSFGAWIL